MFDGWHLIAPGLVDLAHWRPNDGNPSTASRGRHGYLAGVGRKD